ncbi:XK- protein 7 [Desmophyllum pertusum]|uniref:XK-related protein n=1 Tax=Desmophyllum pertusum TaxID=174260 RepID=A0A9W9YRN7_9CNID|nr:XK- protein 7 [Desmophyllum pertusum]
MAWYCDILLFVGIIFSFADPITDILTLVGFYRADHKTWFGVGLMFVILPCLAYPLIRYSIRKKCAEAIICGCHPFSASFARLQGFLYRASSVSASDQDLESQVEDTLKQIDYAVLLESVLEAAPQFILQLYAMSVQEEPVQTIQEISLSVSFFSITWAFTSADERLHDNLKLAVKNKVGLFVIYLFLLSSRLFAVCYFIVSYKWWIIVVLLLHSLVIEIAGMFWLGLRWEWQQCGSEGFLPAQLNFCVCWLRDDVSFHTQIRKRETQTTKLKIIHLLSNILYVTENFAMILFYYKSEHSNARYSLPVTVCVCLFSVIGAIMRVFHLRYYFGESSGLLGGLCCCFDGY